MDTTAVLAEELPTLYRSVLDGVTVLERLGERREAAIVRSEAIDAYSRTWDQATRRRLVRLRRRVDRVVGGHEPPRRSPPRRLGLQRQVLARR